MYCSDYHLQIKGCISIQKNTKQMFTFFSDEFTCVSNISAMSQYSKRSVQLCTYTY